uniref:CCHC-type domain-containing protein n=1 Tax=Ananas comosus var. bracteatus TaxID=296719 RepID=A0A6V7QGW3_ANACO|nr:unnamed protein product [Ananas comosus var. bracteatus]
MHKAKPKIDQPTVAKSKRQRWKKHLPRFEKQQSITPEEFRKACYDALDDMKLRCFWCGMKGHAYDVCVKLRDHRKNKLQFKESCRVITVSEEQSEDFVNQRNMVRQPAVACEDSDSAWIAYNTPAGITVQGESNIVFSR